MLFNGIRHDNGEQTIEDALQRLQQQKQSLGLPEPWSLAELRPTDEDYQWLLAWAAHLPWLTVQRLKAQPLPGQMVRTHRLRLGLGALLLFLFAEIVRREGSEGAVWPPIWKRLSNSGTGINTLFTNQIASTECRDLLRDAARYLALRHVFDETGVQAWLGTIYLQFGFTHRGFLATLPDWLRAEQQTLAICNLRSGRLRSRSFDVIWGALWNLRRGRVSLQQVREQLAQSEWIMDAWIPELLNKATERRRADEPNTDHAPGAEPEPEPDFLGVPRLIVSSDNIPVFSCTVLGNYPFDPTSSRYEIVLGEQALGLLLRQENDTFALYEGTEIVIPAYHPVVNITLRDEAGETVAAQEATLWTPDISLFDSTGCPQDATPILQRASSYFLVCSPDLNLEADVRLEPIYASSRLQLFRLSTGWSDSIRVTANGQPLWQPQTAVRATPNVPDWAQNVSVTILTDVPDRRWGNPLRLSIRHSEKATVEFVRCAGMPLDHTSDAPGRTRIAGLRLDPALHRPRLTLLIGLKWGEEYHMLPRSIDTSAFAGCAIYACGEIKAFRDRDTFELSSAQRTYRFFHPDPDRGRVEGAMWTLMEGDFWVISPPQRPCHLSDLAGYGAPLTLRYGPYNAGPGESVSIARAVEDHGILTEVQVKDTLTDRQLRIDLDRPIDLPAPEHRLRIWSRQSSQEHIVPAQAIQAAGATWTIPWADEPIPCIVSLFYGESRLGTWWSSDYWHKPFKALLAEDVGQAARLLRALKLPVLNEMYLSTVRWMALNHDPGRFLAAWLEPFDAHDSSSDSGRWEEVIRRVFSGWKTDPETATRTLSTIGDAFDPGRANAWLHGARQLALVDPILMARLVYTHGAQATPAGKEAIRWLLFAISDCSDGDCISRRYQEQLAEVKRRIVDSGTMDEGFIEHGLLRPAQSLVESSFVTKIQQDNVCMALQVPAFRLLLTLYLIQKML
jgi:hypothetical protein